MDKRTLLAIVLSLVLVIVYQNFFLKKPVPEQQPSATIEETQDVVAGKAAPDETIVTKAAPAPETVLIKKPDAEVAAQDITVDTPLYTAVFSTRGAALKSLKLKKYRETLDKEAGYIELVNVMEGMNYPLSLSFPKSSINVSPDIIYTTDTTSITLTETTDIATLKFSREYPGEIRIDKVYTIYAGKYNFDLEVDVVNLSKEIIKQSALLAWTRYVDPDVKIDRYSHEGPVSYVKEKLETDKVTKLDEPELYGPDVSWAGYESKYFIAVAIPQQPSLTNLAVSRDSENLVRVDLEGPKNIILPGQAGTFKYGLYAGPKDYDITKEVGVGIENSINFGSWIKWLALPLLVVLKFIYTYVHNYGFAILILTFLVKIIFWPLGNISYRSMKEMQKLQPKINEIRERYKDDKQKINQEVMSLYKTYKVNPMSGCLPMLIQLPVFLGLYKALLYSIELRHSPLMFWIQDLSAKDPYYITPIIMGATMFLQQKMSPQPGGDAMQAKLMMWMPVIFTFLFLNFPSGLVVYWLFNNVLSIGQQYYVNKRKS